MLLNYTENEKEFLRYKFYKEGLTEEQVEFKIRKMIINIIFLEELRKLPLLSTKSLQLP